ncbi:hypothetical protein C3L33_15273, partial [Rhododendron williamsianum]
MEASPHSARLSTPSLFPEFQLNNSPVPSTGFTKVMGIDQSLMATVTITVEEFLGQQWITLAALGRAALIGAQSIIHLDDFQRSI